jgi:hypothetical protein
MAAQGNGALPSCRRSRREVLVPIESLARVARPPGRMRHRLATLALALVAPLALAAARPAVEVRRSYDALEGALVARDADAALARLSDASLAEWARLRALALRGPLAEVEALAPGPRLAVLALRHAAPVWLLRDGPPRETAAAAVRAGLVDRAAAAQVALADVAVLGPARALGQLHAAGLPSGFRAGFVREADAWKLDLPATLDGVGRVVTQVARTTGASENAVIVNLIAVATGEPVGGAVWRPLLGEERPAQDEAGRLGY